MLKYVRTVMSSGPNTNGMNIYGFKRIGSPKITGSLMPKIDGTSDATPMDLNDFAFDFIINRTRPNVNPEPAT